MPQNADTGRRGYESGYGGADAIGELLGATRLSSRSNEFQWGDRNVLVKTGSSGAVATRASLSRVDAVVFGEQTKHGWDLYEIPPDVFERISVQSQSKNHNEDYRSVRRSQLREFGQPVAVAR